MATTAINALPSPTDASPNDPPIHFDALNAVLDTRLVARFATTTARDAAITAPVNGMTVWCDSPGTYYDRVGGAWLQRQMTWTAFAPTWAATGGTPAIGNGTLTGRYFRTGNSCMFRIELRTGSTTNGTTGGWSFTNLPFTATGTVEQAVLCKAYTNFNYNWVGFALLNATTVIPYLPINNGSPVVDQVRNADATAGTGTGIPQIGGQFTFTGVTTRNLVISGTYEIA